MRLEVNNEPFELTGEGTVDNLLATKGLSAAGIAVAVNGAVVRKDSWGEPLLKENDKVLIIKAAYGG